MGLNWSLEKGPHGGSGLAGRLVKVVPTGTLRHLPTYLAGPRRDRRGAQEAGGGGGRGQEGPRKDAGGRQDAGVNGCACPPLWACYCSRPI